MQGLEFFDEFHNLNSLPLEIRSNWELWCSFPLLYEVWNSHESILWSSSARGLEFLVILKPFFSPVRVLWSVIPFFFRAKFGISDELMLCPFFARGLEFWWPSNFSSLLHEIWSDILFFFSTRFGMVSFLFHLRFKNNFCKMTLLSSSARGFDFLLKNNTSTFFRTRFEADLDLLILLSFSTRGSKLIF